MGPRRGGDFCFAAPVPREALAKVVGTNCNLDDLIADIRDELRARPYDLVFVAGGYQLRTKPRYAGAIRALGNGAKDSSPPELTPTELLAVTTIAYLQPATRAELSRLIGKEVSRDIIARLRSLDLIAAGPRAGILARPTPMSRRESFSKFLASPAFAICPTSKVSRRRIAPTARDEIDLDDVLGIGEDDRELVDEMEGED